MLPGISRRLQTHRAFTLVELLVVIGIIALLISILLPALNSARKQAYQAKCASNLRQISSALLMYVADNKGVLPPAMISDNSGKTTDPSNPYPNGWFWAAELMHQRYIAAPNLYLPGKGLTRDYSRSSVFQCPNAVAPEDAGSFVSGADGGVAGTSSSTLGAYPTDPKNSIAVYGISANQVVNGTASLVDANGTPNGQPYYAVATWYQLCSVTTTTGNDSGTYPIGIYDAPFVFFDVTKKGSLGIAGQLALPGYTRKLTQIKQPTIMCMIAEAANIQWVFHGATPTNNAAPSSSSAPPAIAARHGKQTADGKNAMTNIAFFDGHVASLPTAPIVNYADPSSSATGAAVIPQSMNVVFTLAQDR